MQSTEASFGVVPFENSSNGAVLLTLDCLIDRNYEHPDVFICGEAYLDVQHCLVGFHPPKSHTGMRDPLSPLSSGQATPTTKEPSPQKPRSQPLVDLKHVTDVYSHPQAFGQSQRFLSTYLKGVRQNETTSTSKAAEMVAEQQDLSKAAISSKLAGEFNELSLLAMGIQDSEDNTTRFLILHCNRQFETESTVDDDKVADFKALIMFTVDHKSPGALENALHVFAKEELNLTNFNSRPSRIQLWHYIFLVECQSRAKRTSMKLQIERTLEDLKIVTEDRRCLGYWQERTVC